MENIKNGLLHNKQAITNRVNDSLGSLFTKDDVKAIIENIYNDSLAIIETHYNTSQNNAQSTINHLGIVQVLEDVLDGFGSRIDGGMVEITNESFSIDYSNEVRLDEYEVDVSGYNGEIISNFKDALSEYSLASSISERISQTQSEVSA